MIKKIFCSIFILLFCGYLVGYLVSIFSDLSQNIEFRGLSLLPMILLLCLFIVEIVNCIFIILNKKSQFFQIWFWISFALSQSFLAYAIFLCTYFGQVQAAFLTKIILQVVYFFLVYFSYTVFCVFIARKKLSQSAGMN